jgi:outer membrane lipoprotein-sorting protein
MNRQDSPKLRRARSFLGFLPALLACFSTSAQQVVPAAPLTADEVMAKVARMNRQRATELQSYSSLRTYHLVCHCLVHKTADMTVRVAYRSPDQKEFTIVSEGGSGTIRDRVLKRLLEAEVESMQPHNQQRTEITVENYTFRLLKSPQTGANDSYVLQATPRHKNKFLFRGRIWVDARDFAVTRVEGEPAVNPSWWTPKTDFVRVYRRVGTFWLPESNESVTQVRIFGTADLTISYGDYKTAEAPSTTLASLLGRQSHEQ